MQEVTRSLENMDVYVDDTLFASHFEKQRSAYLRAHFNGLGKCSATIKAPK